MFMRLFWLFFVVFIVFSKDNKVFGEEETYINRNVQAELGTLGNFGSFISKSDSFLHLNLDSAILYINKAKEVINFNSDLERTIFYYHKCKVDHFSYKFDDTSNDMARDGLALAEKNRYLYYQLKFHKIFAQHAYPNWENQYHHNLKALEIAKKIENKREVTMVLINITIALVNHNNPEKARVYLKEIRLNLDPDITKPENYIRYYKVASNLEEELKPALVYLDSALNIAEVNEMYYFQVKLYAEMSALYEKHNDIEKAIIAFEKSDSLLEVKGISHLNDAYDFQRAKFYYIVEDFETAKTHLEKYKGVANQHHIAGFNYWAYKIYEGIGDFEKAFQYSEKYTEEIFSEKERREDSLYIEFQNKHHVDQMKLRDVINNQKLREKSVQNKMIIVIGVLFIIVLSYLYYVRYQKKKYQLQAAQQILEKEKELNIYRIRFMENITHEVRTPLTILRGVFHFLQGELSNSKFSNLIDIGYKNSEQLKYDMEQILQSIALEPYSKSVQKTPTKLLSFFSDLIQQYTFRTHVKGVVIELEHNLTEYSSCSIDTDKIATIFKNYLTNAIKYSLEGGKIIIRITATRDNLKFSIDNFGFIIEEDDRERIFERYYQTSQEDGNTSGGFGIGLSIVKDLADMMSAQVGVQSDLSIKSTTFYCNLKGRTTQFSNSTTIKTFNIEHYKSELSDLNISQTKPKVLVVDDNEMMIGFYKEILVNVFDCDFALHGSKAIELFNENHYDCIISDIMMPEMDGFQFFNELTNTAENNIIPIIFVTAKDFEEVKLDAFRIGVQDFISKPFIIKELIARVNNVITNNTNRLLLEKSDVNTKPKIKEEGFNDDKMLLDKIVRIIDKNLAEPEFSIAVLAESVFYSSRQLARKTTFLTGLSPSQLILERKLLKAEYVLKTTTNIRISEVQKLIGIKSTAYFNRKFKERFGITPSDLRRNVV